MSVRLYRLHFEILQFYQFMIPTEEEHSVRQQVINRITNVISQYIPTASVRKKIRKKKQFLFIVFFLLG